MVTVITWSCLCTEPFWILFADSEKYPGVENSSCWIYVINIYNCPGLPLPLPCNFSVRVKFPCKNKKKLGKQWNLRRNNVFRNSQLDYDTLQRIIAQITIKHSSRMPTECASYGTIWTWGGIPCTMRHCTLRSKLYRFEHIQVRSHVQRVPGLGPCTVGNPYPAPGQNDW